MKNQFIDIIVQRLNETKHQLKQQFFCQHPIQVARHFALDNLLPCELAKKIYQDFPIPKKMRLLNSRGELKLKYCHIKNATALLQDLHFAIQDPKVIAVIEEITKIPQQEPDPSSHAGGLSALLKGYYINPHLDNSHDAARKLYRAVNVLYYVTPNWKLENGGNYELWDVSVTKRIILPSLFNRLVVMETNRISWHAVNPVVCDEPRRCIFNYYFSKQSPEGENYFHGPASTFLKPLFKPRPEQKLRRAISDVRDAVLKF